jgi:hypothetical protein
MLLGVAAKPGPKHFQKEPIALGPPAQQDPILLGVAEPDPKHFKKRLGLTAQPDPSILDLARQLNPISLGLVAWPLGVSKKNEKPRKLEKNKQKN